MNRCISKIEQRARQANSLVCVGLDTEYEHASAQFPQTTHPQLAFNTWIIEETASYAAAFKINTAFYEAHGHASQHALEQTCAYIHKRYPQIPLILDAKRADIGNTNKGTKAWAFSLLRADAVTLHPYMGSEALSPFLESTQTANIILCRTSNPGAGELQDLLVDGRPLWQHVASQVIKQWNSRGNCMLVVGATYPKEMIAIREIAPEMWFLVPGIGAQGGDLQETLTAGLRNDGLGLLINSSRAIIQSSDPAQAARDLRDAINAIREERGYGTISSS